MASDHQWSGTGPIPSSAKGKGKAVTPDSVVVSASGAAVWEQTPEKRQASLQSRKEAMILAARQYVHLTIIAFY